MITKMWQLKQLVQGVARQGHERGANLHETSLIWAAKDTELKKLEEKGAVRILSGDSAEKAKTQIANRFIPSRFVVPRPNPEEFKARWWSARILGSRRHGIGWQWFHSISNCVSWDECFLVR